MLFGTTFVVVQDAVRDVEPVPFLAVRFLIGALALAPFAWRAPRQPGRSTAALWCGAALLVGYLFQTVGLQYTTAAVSAFVTYLLVIIVPVLAVVVVRRPPSRPVMAGVVLAAVGLFLLTGATELGFGRGEALTLGCAVAFAIHIVLLSELSPRFDTTALTALQLLLVGGACLLPGAFLGGYRLTAAAWVAAAYTGVTASALAFALQVYGQRRVGPTRTSLLLMMEPVSAAFLGYVTGEGLGPLAAVGAVLILAGVAVAELPTADAS